jgi:hypothetical protein
MNLHQNNVQIIKTQKKFPCLFFRLIIIIYFSLFSDISGVTAAKSECDGLQVDGNFTAAVSPYQCSVCERVYKIKSNLSKHLKMHQSNEINDKGLFQCEVCNKQYDRK